MIQRDSASIRDKSHTRVHSSMLTDIYHICTSAPAHRLMSHNVHCTQAYTTYIHMCTCTQTYSPGTCAPSYRHTSHTYHTCTYTCMCTQVLSHTCTCALTHIQRGMCARTCTCHTVSSYQLLCSLISCQPLAIVESSVSGRR